MSVALITGITGQDGVYMTELLMERGYKVIGAVRDLKSALAKVPLDWIGVVEFVEWDMLNQEKMIEVLSLYRPTELYNFAAHSSGIGMYDDPVSIGQVNGLAVVRILEAIRSVDVSIRFAQASSREIFGEAIESPQTETTLVNPRSPYGAAKLYADNMIRIYRQQYNLFACSAILYNHESPHRGLAFVTRKITHEVSRIKLGFTSGLYLGNLDARRDWGFAGDTVYAMWLMLQHNNPDDYIVATGETYTVREFCECAFEYVGLDYREYVQEDRSAYRPVESSVLVGNALKAKTLLGWTPKVKFRELVHMMVDVDMQIIKGK